MYLSNKYTKWYNSIITAAKTRITSEYVERHHILPKSLGGSNEKDNIIKLTAREHFICHWLLPKMTEDIDRHKMICALSKMRCINGKQQRYTTKITSRVFEMLRKEHASAISIINSGRKHSDETKEKHRKLSTGRVHSDEAKTKMRKPKTDEAKANMRKPKSAEHVAKVALANKGKQRSDETRSKISARRKGIATSAESNAKRSATLSGRPWSAARRAAYESKLSNP